MDTMGWDQERGRRLHPENDLGKFSMSNIPGREKCWVLGSPTMVISIVDLESDGIVSAWRSLSLVAFGNERMVPGFQPHIFDLYFSSYLLTMKQSEVINRSQLVLLT